MILHFDSTFRNILQYPNPTEFEIDVNGQPPRSAQVLDARCQYTTDDYAQFSFKWIGTTMVPGLSTVENDAYPITFIPIQANQLVLVSNDELVKRLGNDYFVGTLFYDTVSKQSSPVISFQRDVFVITLASPLFKTFCQITFQEFIQSKSSSDLIQDGYFINPTKSEGKNLLILGSTKLIPETQTEVALARGLNTNLFVENVSKGWTSKISSIKGVYRSVILSEFPSYDSNDIFIVWKIPTYTGKIKDRLFVSGLLDFRVLPTDECFCRHERLFNNDACVEFEVLDIDVTGHIVNLRCCRPGQYLSVGQIIPLYRHGHENVVVSVQVVRTENGLLPTIDPSVFSTSIRFIIGFFYPQNFNVIYFSLIAYRPPILYIDIPEDVVIELNANLNTSDSFFLIPFRALYPTITVPLIADMNPVCYTVSITSISLPNLPVCGFNVLLSDLPYILVTLSTTNGSLSVDNYGTMSSNNPNAVTANFVCPIANIRNADIVKFVVVNSSQTTTFKFTPRNSLLFRVTLPNGEILRYTDTSIPYTYPCSYETGQTGSCQGINLPLTLFSQSENTIKVFPFQISNLVSATFMLTRLT